MDLTNKLSQIYKENTAPNQAPKIQKTNSRSILNNNNLKRSSSRNSLQGNAATTSTTTLSLPNSKSKRMSMSDVSDMLYEFYRANAAAKAPKSQGTQQQQMAIASGAVKYVSQTSPTSAETNEPSSIAAIATNGAASETAPKNLQSDEMVTSKSSASFHPPIKFADSDNKVPSISKSIEYNVPKIITAIPTSVVVPPTSSSAEPLDIKPIIHPSTGLVITPNTSVIKPVPVASTSSNPQAAAIAAALIRDGYHSFQQQMRAQEIIKFHTGKLKKNLKAEDASATTILESFLRQQTNSDCDNETTSDNNEGDDEDDSRYSGFEDIHLMESSKTQFPQMLQNVMAQNSSSGTPGSGDYYSDESQKYINLAAQAQAFRNIDFSMGDFSNSSLNDNNAGPTSIGPDGEPVYECRHCGKKYRWKSTLRRHENVECGGKEPSHQCPYCPYKSKQRGNLGVHVRKHHSNLPQLASRRRSKYSIKLESNPSIKNESNPNSANVSDDSNSKLIIDCSK